MTGVIQVEDLWRGLLSWFSFLPRITLTNVFEIFIIAFLVYEILYWIMNTRAWTLLKGLLVIGLFALMAALLHLNTILWILEKTTTIAVTALVIIFQPELRKALEQLGSQNLISGILAFDDGKEEAAFTERIANEIVKATFEMAKVKTGALMVLERNMPLKEIERTGIEINGLVSSQLLINIFEHNTPLHDGAVIVRGNRIVAATCYLPLSDNRELSKQLGTRHRAGVGISEVSDSLTIIVSEETGHVSMVQGGVLHRGVTFSELKKAMRAVQNKTYMNNGKFRIWKRGRDRNEKDSDE